MVGNGIVFLGVLGRLEGYEIIEENVKKKMCKFEFVCFVFLILLFLIMLFKVDIVEKWKNVLVMIVDDFGL